MENKQDFIMDGDVLLKYVSHDENVVVPENVTKIGSCAFAGCKSLTEITIPAGVKKIPGSISTGAFSHCFRLKK